MSESLLYLIALLPLWLWHTYVCPLLVDLVLYMSMLPTPLVVGDEVRFA